MSGKEKKKYRFEGLLSNYFNNFHRLLLTNILFAVPSAIAFFILYFINQLAFKSQQIMILLFAIILVYPFYSGVTLVTRNIARGDRDVKVFSTFIKGVKENFAPFILHGVLLYIATIISYFSISLYISMIKNPEISVKWYLWCMLIISIIIALLLLYTFFYIPVMTVTYDIKKRYIYKNSFLMSFGEFKVNLLATLFLLIVASIVATLIFFTASYSVFFIILSIVIYVFILPSTISYNINFFVYEPMNDLISNKEARKEELENKISGKSTNKNEELVLEDISDLDISKLKNPDDFIFYKGKMIKQSTLIKMLEEKESKSSDE